MDRSLYARVAQTVRFRRGRWNPRALPTNPVLTTLSASVRRTSSVVQNDKISPDQQFWWDTCSPSVKSLLKHSGTYTTQEQEEHMRFFADSVVPNLGPRPSPDFRSTSLLNRDGTPFRPSWNFSGSGTATLRIGYDPVGPKDGTVDDPFGQNYLRESLSGFAEAANPTADMTWYKQLMDSMYLTTAEEATLHARWPRDMPRPPHHFFAYGCKGPQREFKPYFHPFLKVESTRKTSPQVIYEAIHSVTTLGDDLAPGINVVEQYTNSRHGVMTPHMIGVDCVEPAKARLKIYVMAPSNAFNMMHDAMTLGGKMADPETLRGVSILRDIYLLLLNETGPLDPATSREPRNPYTAHKNSIISFEMKPGRVIPEVKIYLPLWQFAETEGEITENMSEVFRRFGWFETAKTYGAALQESL
jgi:DMATS type aromatic prenyltransferase